MFKQLMNTKFANNFIFIYSFRNPIQFSMISTDLTQLSITIQSLVSTHK